MPEMTVAEALSMAGMTTWATYDRVTVDAALAVLAREVRRLQAHAVNFCPYCRTKIEWEDEP